MSENKKLFGLNTFYLKIIACVLMTLDHVALLFVNGSNPDQYTLYYVLRAIGKISFPLFAFMAVEGVYHSKDVIKYLLRLLLFALALDMFGYGVSFFTYLANNSSYISVADNPLIGNAFTDMFLGVLAVYLLRKKNFYSLLAVLPIAYAFLSRYWLNNEWGYLFKTDWGAFSIVLFVLYFLFREIADYYLSYKANSLGMDKEIYAEMYSLKLHKILEIIALIITELVFYLIFRFDNTNFLLPNEFVPIGTYSTLAGIFLAFYNGEKGYSSKKIQYAFYLYYPLHIIILAIFSLVFGRLGEIL